LLVRSGSRPGGSGRAALARFAAPAAFLLVVTVAVLLVRSAVSDGTPSTPGTTAARTTTHTSTRTSTRARTPTSPEARQSYTIQAGDTLASVATRYGTTVERLVALNPGIDPTSLQVGQQIRVK